MTIFSASNLAKSFDDKFLFRNISFGMEEGERVGIIGRNGVGKTTLLRIIAGVEHADEGEVTFNRQARFEYLRQLPEFAEEAIALDAVMDARRELRRDLDKHAALCARLGGADNDDVTQALEEVTARIEAAHGWNLENDATTILHRLGVHDPRVSTATMSGGQRKRVALARVLLSDPDLLILDEPTNHLDADSVQYLQDRLQNSSRSLLMITHDRYFLDAVCNRIVEVDQQRLYSYPGSYEKYLEQKETLIQTQDSAAEHLRNKLRRELDWLAAGAKARRTKARGRIKWIEEMQAAPKRTEQKDIKIEIGKSFLGSRIVDAVNTSRSINGHTLFKKFDYIAAPGDRIGIIGPNGSGKSTLLRVLSGELETESGYVKLGQSVNIGFFRQEIHDLKPTQSMIGSLREIAEYIDTGEGRDRYLTARDLLERFQFPHKRHGSQIQTLSGGEKRRLMLLRVLMSNPNVLMLDEPTNDFDINTLSALEEWLEYFQGVLLIVSHDRAFLDRTVHHIYAFEEDGHIKKYPGNYSAYLEKKEAADKERSAAKSAAAPEPKDTRTQRRSKKVRLTYAEKIEFEKLENEIADLEDNKTELESALSAAADMDYKEMAAKSEELQQLNTLIEDKMMRWMELSEKAEGSDQDD